MESKIKTQLTQLFIKAGLDPNKSSHQACIQGFQDLLSYERNKVFYKYFKLHNLVITETEGSSSYTLFFLRTQEKLTPEILTQELNELKELPIFSRDDCDTIYSPYFDPYQAIDSDLFIITHTASF